MRLLPAPLWGRRPEGPSPPLRCSRHQYGLEPDQRQVGKLLTRGTSTVVRPWPPVRTFGLPPATSQPVSGKLAALTAHAWCSTRRRSRPRLRLRSESGACVMWRARPKSATPHCSRCSGGTAGQTWSRSRSWRRPLHAIFGLVRPSGGTEAGSSRPCLGARLSARWRSIRGECSSAPKRSRLQRPLLDRRRAYFAVWPRRETSSGLVLVVARIRGTLRCGERGRRLCAEVQRARFCPCSTSPTHLPELLRARRLPQTEATALVGVLCARTTSGSG